MGAAKWSHETVVLALKKNRSWFTAWFVTVFVTLISWQIFLSFPTWGTSTQRRNRTIVGKRKWNQLWCRQTSSKIKYISSAKVPRQFFLCKNSRLLQDLHSTEVWCWLFLCAFSSSLLVYVCKIVFRVYIFSVYIPRREDDFFLRSNMFTILCVTQVNRITCLNCL